MEPMEYPRLTAKKQQKLDNNNKKKQRKLKIYGIIELDIESSIIHSYKLISDNKYNTKQVKKRALK